MKSSLRSRTVWTLASLAFLDGAFAAVAVLEQSYTLPAPVAAVNLVVTALVLPWLRGATSSPVAAHPLRVVGAVVVAMLAGAGVGLGWIALR